MGSNGLLLRMIKVFVRVSEDVPQGQFFAKVRAATWLSSGFILFHLRTQPAL